METHEQNMKHLREMLSHLKEQRSSWQLTEEEREISQKYLKALEAAMEALDCQIYA